LLIGVLAEGIVQTLIQRMAVPEQYTALVALIRLLIDRLGPQWSNALQRNQSPPGRTHRDEQ